MRVPSFTYVRPDATVDSIYSNIQQTLGMLLPDPNTYAAPEVKSGGWSVLKRYMVNT